MSEKEKLKQNKKKTEAKQEKLFFLFLLFSLPLSTPFSHESVVVGVVDDAELVDLVRPGAHGDAEGAVAVPAVAGGVGVEGEGKGFVVRRGGGGLGELRRPGEDGGGSRPEDDAGRASRRSSTDGGG